MRRAQRADDSEAVDPAPATDTTDDSQPTIVEPALLQRAREIAARLIDGDLSADDARRRILHACFETDADSPRHPHLQDEVVTLLNNDLQFRAEVDNMLVLAARELEGGAD
jgi:hypothetical protein